MVLVDSSVWIEAARIKGDLSFKVGLEGLLEEYEACWCGVILLEVIGGARQQDRQKLDFYFQAIPYRPMKDSAWGVAKETVWKLRDRGHTIPWNDILIGSLALAWDLRVYAKDYHFEIMRDILGLRLYEPDYGGKFRPE
jgi:predicted nucleic acid-binding protein